MHNIAKTTCGMTRLDRLAPHRHAVVRRIVSVGDVIERLKTLGICPGRQVELVKCGDPLILRVFRSRLGLSSSLAECVWVECGDVCSCAAKGPHST